MDIQTGSLLLSAISALSSALQAYRTYTRVGESISLEELESKLVKPHIPEESVLVIRNIINEKLLKKSLKRVMDNIEMLINSINGTSLKDRVLIADEVDRDICSELRFLKRYNNGTLPKISHPDLYDIWISHSC